MSNGFELVVGPVIEYQNEDDLAEKINDVMREPMIKWTNEAARGECGWICADCCGHSSDGMPDECFYGQQGCTEIIQRDKKHAYEQVGNAT
ncbi:hypothetical protein [Vreelandella populi]|uniref:hypothetical protein n=1 Tax=Vreelandella populi TaxID=2498858 RepID=UPI000F8C4E23|nr:hypothetical protein [Halomonas populi]RUR38538.1 hypothetical protein ELY25_09245 [Halomonas populi]